LARVTLHIADNATDNFVEVDGKPLETDGVHYAMVEGSGKASITLERVDVDVVDERTGSGGS
jgi:hypothetical protein